MIFAAARVKIFRVTHISENKSIFLFSLNMDLQCNGLCT